MAPVARRLMNAVEALGWKARIVPLGRLADLETAVRARHERGLFDAVLYREQLDAFSFDSPPDLPDARSIIVVALRVPQTRILFRWKGARCPVVVPPTYAGYSTTTGRVQAILSAWLETAAHRLAKPSLPLKTLAAGSGLAQYGRNNLCYVPGMGSFLQLVAAFSDLPCVEDPWQEPRALERCESCPVCMRRCPSGAIGRDRFLLHAERCLTYHNESARELPAWFEPSWHHCLVGCLRCQSTCPENKSVLGWFDDRAEFSEEETALLAARVPFEQLPAQTAAKMRDLELNEDYRVLCRNLAILLGRAGGPASG